jgi:predicted ATPase
MQIAHIKLKNRLDFRKVDIDLSASSYLISPNASGKSNFLDVFR